MRAYLQRVAQSCLQSKSVLLCFGGLLFLAQPADAFRGLKQGDPAPAFTLKSTSGESVSLKTHQGKAVIVAFLRLGQPTSEGLLAELTHLGSSLGERTSILAVVVNPAEGDASAWSAPAAGRFAVLLDSSGEVYSSYGVVVTPSTGVLKPDGTFLEELGGFSSSHWESLENLLKVALGLTTREELDAAAARGPAPALSQKRKTAERETEKAVLLASRKMREKAVEVAKRAVAEDDTYVGAHNVLGRLLLDGSPANADEALRHFERAQELAPGEVESVTGIARVKSLKGDYQAAVATLEKAAAAGTATGRVYYYLGEVHQRAGQLDRAAAAYRKALELALEERE